MATENDFLYFAGSATNIDSHATYAGLGAIANGFPSGILASVDLNKVLRQGTSFPAALGLMMSNFGVAAVDSGNAATLLTTLLQAFASAGFLANLGFQYSFAAGSAYIRFPGGGIIQWTHGSTSTAGNVTVTLPMTFPTANSVAFALPNVSSTASIPIMGANPSNNSTTNVYSANTSGTGVSVGFFLLAAGY